MTTTIEPQNDHRQTESAEFELVSYDFYKDIHKGIRGELFRVTALAGNLDPGERCARAQLAERVNTLFDLLVAHAQHEDDFVQPHVVTYAPFYAEVIAADHERLEDQMVDIRGRVERAATAPSAEQAGRVRHCYWDLAAFTSAYLEHQDFEERRVMPALDAVMDTDELIAIDQAIVASIPPDQLAVGLGLMLPAMNIDDRAAMLGGMQAGAPPEVFAGVWALAGSMLTPADYRALGARLGIA